MGLQRCTELGCAPVCSGQKTEGRNGSVGVGWGSEAVFWRRRVRVIPENPVSILSGDVTGCEWADSACIRFNK